MGAPIKWDKPDRNSVTKTKTTAEPTKDCARDEGEILRTLTSSVGMKKVLKIMKKLGLPFSRKHNAMHDLVDFCLLLLTAYNGRGTIHPINGQYMRSKRIEGPELLSRTWMYNIIKTARSDYILKRCMAIIRSTISQARLHRLPHSCS